MDSSVTGLDEVIDLAEGDWHYVVDVSDTTGGVNGTGKKTKQSSVLDKLDALKIRMTADGSITAGQAVEFLEGKLKVGGGDNMTQAAEVTGSTDNGSQISACVLSETSFAVVFISPTNTCESLIATISGTTITYGTQVQVDSGTCSGPSVCALTSTKIAVTYGLSGTGGRTKLATISGTVPSFGSGVTFNPNTVTFTNCISLSDSLFAVAYNNVTLTFTEMRAATVSGTVPTFGSVLQIITQTSNVNFLVKMNSTTIVGFTVPLTSPPGLYYIVNYSSSTLTLGETYPSLTKTLGAANQSFARLSSDTIIQVFGGWDSYGYARLITLNNIELKVSPDFKVTPATLTPGGQAVVGLDENRAVAFFDLAATAVAYVLEIQNETISVKNFVVVSGSSVVGAPFIIAPNTDKVVTVYIRSTDLMSRLIQVSKFIGVAATSVSNGETVRAVVKGVSAAHSGLVVGARYYTDLAGAISTDVSGKFLGIAISSTQILLQNALDKAGASRSDLIDSVPVAYTPTFTGFGTVTVFNAKSWRIGSELFFEITFTAGTNTGVEARVSLGYKGTNGNVTTINTYPTLAICGNAANDTSGTGAIIPLIESSVAYFTIGRAVAGTVAGLAKRAGTDFANGAILSFKGSVRITGW